MIWLPWQSLTDVHYFLIRDQTLKARVGGGHGGGKYLIENRTFTFFCTLPYCYITFTDGDMVHSGIYI